MEGNGATSQRRYQRCWVNKTWKEVSKVHDHEYRIGINYFDVSWLWAGKEQESKEQEQKQDQKRETERRGRIKKKIK